ncbi:unnamed protein product [Urochloa decumbens]|uniref:DUF1618 domain-containing protein n=1 Tax=Urochloa decumbens TaxID=240449 RepID=A0ABC9AQR8_9POAL
MKLLTCLAHGHGSLHGHSLSRCLRSLHLVPDGQHPAEPITNSPSPAAAMDNPSWVLLHSRNCRWNNSIDASDKTAAEARTSTGQRLRVAFDLAPPPASSVLNYECAEATRVEKHGSGVNIIASHGDSVLLRMSRDRRPLPPAAPCDHFVYRAGGAGRVPTLSLLPLLKVMEKYKEGVEDPSFRPLLNHDTGILQRGDDGLLVARIELLIEDDERRRMAHLNVLRPGMSQWEHKRLVPVVHEEGEETMGPLCGPNMAIPVGDRFLCWVGDHSSFILCDMANVASPKLRHVPLPGMPCDPDYYSDDHDLRPLRDSVNMGAAGPGAVRFVAIEPRCCCGGFGRSSCPRSRYAFTVTTWTLTLTMDEPVTWVKESVMDCEELWGLPGYEGIPRVHLQCPVVSLDNPDILSFRVVSNADRKAWMIQVDTRRKLLLGAVQCDARISYDARYLRQAILQ